MGLEPGENLYQFGPNTQRWVDPLGLTCKKGKAKTYADYAREATKNPRSSEVMLGKYKQDGVSYVEEAIKRKSTYFELDDWDAVSKKIGIDNMWNINKEFLNQQLKAGKNIVCSHDPWKATGYFQDEVLHLIDSGATDFVKVGTNLWKVVF